MTLFLLLFASASFAHVTEIRVNQAQDGSLTWYLSSYHSVYECGIGGSGLRINGVNYPLQSAHQGDVANLSSTVFASSGGSHVSYAIVRTPFLGTSLSVQPYSSNVCWAFSVGGNGSFTPPPPPVCTSSPLSSWTNTVAATGNNMGTACNPQDDQTKAFIKVSHLACASITGDKQFRVIYDPAGANLSYGPFTYAAGMETNVAIPIPYGASNATQVKVIDDDFPAEITHSLSVPNGQYLGEKETVPPTLAVAAAMQVGNDKGVCGAVVNYPAPNAADNCGLVKVLQTAGLASGAVFPTGTTTNTFLATDAAGNTTSASFTVTVKDTEAPAFASLPVVTGSCSATVSAAPTAQDNCVGMVTATTTDPLTYTTQGTHLINWKFDDGKGNISTATQQVIVKDVTAPTIATPAAIAVSNDAGKCGAAVKLAEPATADNCAVAQVTNDAPAFFATGTTTVTWTVTDVNGNTATTTQAVKVTDTEAPVAKAQNISVTLVNGLATITGADLDGGSTDNCAIASLALSKTSFSCEELGDHTVTLTVTDANGNAAAATAVVTVIGSKPLPAIAVSRTDNTYTGAGTEQTIFLGYGAQSLILTASNPASAAAASTYSWSPAQHLSSTSGASPVFTPTSSGTFTYVVTVTNEFGCTATTSVTLTVIEARATVGNSNNKGIMVCHKGKGIVVGANAVQAHLAHGCTIGSCTTAGAANARMALNVEVAEQTSLTVYPNPVVSKATAEFTLVAATNYQLEVYDMKGTLLKVIAKGSGEANQFLSFELNAAAYPAGVYLVKLTTDHGTFAKRIVVQK